MSIIDDDAEQARVWQILYDRLQNILRRYGKEDFIAKADYWLLDDNWGPRQQMLYVNSLKMMAPDIVKLMQSCLVEFPDWEIVLSVAVQGVGKSWPEMGIVIRAHEIVDNLKREYFPTEFQGIEYQGRKRRDA
jgi:hypothetical protein